MFCLKCRNWTLRKESEKTLEASEIWIWRKMERVKMRERWFRRELEKKEILRTKRKRNRLGSLKSAENEEKIFSADNN